MCCQIRSRSAHLQAGLSSSAPAASTAQIISNTKTTKEIAPKPQASITKVYLRVSDFDSEEFRKAKNLVDIFNEGSTRVIFYDMSTKKYSEYNERIYYSEYVIDQLKGILGDEDVVAK